jgi:hypothetical protein
MPLFQLVPFTFGNKWGFVVKATLFLASGFWFPFMALELQLRKAKQ